MYSEDYVNCDIYINNQDRCYKCSENYVLNYKNRACIYFKDVFDNCL